MGLTCPKCGRHFVYLSDGPYTCICGAQWTVCSPDDEAEKHPTKQSTDAVNAPAHYVGKIETIDYLRDKLTPAEFTGFCMGNVLKYTSRWRKKDGVQDLKKAMVYLKWAIENEEKHTVTGEQLNIPD